MRSSSVRLFVSSIPQGIATIMLAVALFPRLPYSYFVFLRVVVFCCGAYLIYQSFQRKRLLLSWLLFVAVVLYNPFFKIALTRPIWRVVNLLTIALFVAATIYQNLRLGKSLAASSVPGV
jgi:hypothetical protein